MEKHWSDSVSASSLSTSRRSERRVMDTAREQSEPVLQCSIPAGGRISAFTLYSVWSAKGKGRRERMKRKEGPARQAARSPGSGRGAVCPGALARARRKRPRASAGKPDGLGSPASFNAQQSRAAQQGAGRGWPSALVAVVISTVFPASHIYPPTLMYSPEAL